MRIFIILWSVISIGLGFFLIKSIFEEFNYTQHMLIELQKNNDIKDELYRDKCSSNVEANKEYCKNLKEAIHRSEDMIHFSAKHKVVEKYRLIHFFLAIVGLCTFWIIPVGIMKIFASAASLKIP
jgi:hypothetical protein